MIVRWVYALLLVLLATSSAHAANVFSTDVQMCSGRPWIDVTCPLGGFGTGADPTGVADSTAAINAATSAAITSGVPVFFPAGTYTVSSGLVWDYQGQAGNGLEVMSRGATIDGRTVVSGPVLQVQCSGGTTAAPITCQGLRITGGMTVLGAANNYVVALGKTDFSDQHIAARIEHLVVKNTNSSTGAGGIKVNYIKDADLWLSGNTSGGSASVGAVAVEQVQSSLVGGYASALGASAPGLLLENGSSIGDSFVGFDYDVNDAVCISITSTTAMRNAWLAPNLPCNTAVNAPTSANNNAIIGPTFAGTNRGPTSTGISVIGRGALHRYSAPAVSSQTLFGVDDGTIFSAANATGSSTTFAAASIQIVLPDPSTLAPGWTTGFVSDNNKAVVITGPAGSILTSNQKLTTITIGASGTGTGNFEVAELKSDGTNYRVTYISQGAALLNGMATAMPARWYYPGGPGYQATVGDNGGVVSSGQTSGGLAVTLPQVTTLQAGWTVGISADGKSASIQTNGTNGGTLFLPGGAAAPTGPYSIPSGQRTLMWVHFDGVAFRVIPATANVPSTGQFSAAGGAEVIRMGDRLFVGKNTNINDGNLPCTSCDWLETIRPGTTELSQMAALSQNDAIGLIGAVRTSDSPNTPSAGEGVVGFCINDRTAGPFNNCWAGYLESRRMPGVNIGNQIIGLEIDTDELNTLGAVPAHNPYLGFAGAASIGLVLASGGGTAATFPSTVALDINPNTAPFVTGIQFQAKSIYGDDGISGAGEAISLAKGHVINWYTYDPVNCPPCGFVDAYIRSDGASHFNPIGLQFTDGILSVNGSTGATFRVSMGVPNQTEIIELTDFGGAGWDIQKDGSGNFEIFDKLNNANILQASNINRQVTIGSGQSVVFLNGSATGIPAVSTPATPGPGLFYIYMDVADAHLKAMGPLGTVTVLANP